jgi:hypothetical protein
MGKSANKSLVTKEQVKNMISSLKEEVQDKYLTSSVLVASTPPLTGQIVAVTWPAQGVTNGQRESDSLAVDYIESNIVITNLTDSTTLAASSNAVRVICLQAIGTSVLTVSYGAAPLTGVLDFGVSGGVDMTSLVNANSNGTVFHVLSDTTHPCSYLSSNAFVHKYMKMKPKVHKINFTPGTTVSSQGQIYWLTLAQAGTIDISILQRLKYHDL